MTLTNNILRDQPRSGIVNMIASTNSTPTLHNNTMSFTTCTGCGPRRGWFVTGTTPGGEVRDNILINAGTSDFANGFGVYETNATSGLLAFENNALWMPNGGTLYMDNGSTSLLLAAINALSGAGGNIEADPLLDATYHLPAGSPCRNAGKTVAVPLMEFDGDARPQEMSFDIGADEYVP